MTVKRCFIAIEIPEKIKNKLADIQQRLKSWPARVKWVEEENLHLTLKFLGDLRPEQIEIVGKQLEPIGKQSRAFDIRVSGLGCAGAQSYLGRHS